MHSDVPASRPESKRRLFVTPTDDGDSVWLLDVRARLLSGRSLCEQAPPNWNRDTEGTQMLPVAPERVPVPGLVHQPPVLARPRPRGVLCVE